MSILSKITQKTKKIELFSDFRTDFAKHPLNDDVLVKTDEAAVKESIRNLLLTNKGERLFRPNLGSNLRYMLFDSNTPVVLKLIQEQVRDTLETYEPRINIDDINIISNLDDNVVQIVIMFSIRNTEHQLSTTVFLERTR